MIKITKGLDLPITGAPVKKIFSGNPVKTVALLGDDYRGMKPTMLVQVGDKVKKGQPLFEDKKISGVLFTAPVSGVIKEINRGERRAFQSVVIEVQGDEQVQFQNFKGKAAADLTPEEVRALLVESGFWTSLRTRPFSKTPAIDSMPSSIFVNAMDTQPLAPDSEVVLAEHLEDFKVGVAALARLSSKIFVVGPKGLKLDLAGVQNAKVEHFDGPHPAGNVGTHIHFLDPVSASKVVWHLNYQDAIAIGRLFKTGEYFNQKIISIAGPAARNPRLVRTIRGARIDELTVGETFDTAEIRYVSG
jgi:Na+-transporting NADH:ubiquinone oxidoreductase subunit A